MERIFQDYLFQKHILVSTGESEAAHEFETLFALANLFGISITDGKEHVRQEMIAYCSQMLGEKVPEPFYRGFPESARNLAPDQLLFDQLVHYSVTYGFGYFSEAGHSLFEGTFQKLAFRENCEVKEFSILRENEAGKLLAQCVEELLASSRPLNDSQFSLIQNYITKYGYQVGQCASKNTAVRLMVALRDLQFARFLQLSDVIKVVDELNFVGYGNEDLHKLNLKNRDRKFLEKLMDGLFQDRKCDLTNCYEKKDLWCGLLHHIHYRPKCETAREFVQAMRGRENGSVYSAFEKAMSVGNVREAVGILKEGKGTGALLRNLTYLISRAQGPEDISFVLENLESRNTILLLQLLLRFSDKGGVKQEGRTFVFTRHYSLQIHGETPEEIKRRKSVLTKEQEGEIVVFLEKRLTENLKDRLGKVYVDEGMKNMALPLQETSAQSGFGVLAKGSKLLLPGGKKIRAFTYWEKVDDIDLSVIGITEDGEQMEFSWRTMAARQSQGLVYSGDETSGYHGGSEYFDVDPDYFRKEYPTLRYLVFCDNVYSGTNFEKCICRAGYMLRDQMDSGEIYEPKTVQTAFRVNCPSTFAYLFGFDLRTNEFIWLNMNNNNGTTVAGTQNMNFLTDVFGITKVMNVYRFFKMMAQELVEDPAQADIVVSDRAEDWEKANMEKQDAADRNSAKEWIRSYDFDRLMALMNAKK